MNCSTTPFYKMAETEEQRLIRLTKRREYDYFIGFQSHFSRAAHATYSVGTVQSSGRTHIYITRKMVPITGRASSFLEFLFI